MLRLVAGSLRSGQPRSACDSWGLIASAIYVTCFRVPQTLEYLTADGSSPFARWFGNVEANAAAKIRRTVDKLERGLRPDVKAVGGGVFEARIDYGVGYRVYFGLDGDKLVILLGGGGKPTQGEDIPAAKKRWEDYKRRKQLQAKAKRLGE